MPIVRRIPSIALVLAVSALLPGCSHPKPHVVTAITAKLPPDNLPAPPFNTKAQKESAAIARWHNALLTQSVTSETPARLIQVDGILRQAETQPGVKKEIKQLARITGVSFSQMQERWKQVQAADLFLESGDDANAISSAGACGVAQWMPDSATRAGLKVDLSKSTALTKEIVRLEASLHGSLALSSGPTGGAASAKQSGQSAGATNPSLPNTEEIALRIADLQAQRAKIDQRFNPELSIFAQTRYLLGLVHRFPAVDWLFQAYHGGEAGVTRLLRLYSQRASASPANIILGDRHHPKISFGDVYLNCTPKQNVKAFGYLYSRGDDDRHYWWKILAAVDLIPKIIDQSPSVTTAPHRLLQLWYGNNADVYRFQGDKMVTQGVAAGVLVQSPCTQSTCRYYAQNKRATTATALRPIAASALRLIMNNYHNEGGLGLPTVDITTGNPGRSSSQAGLSFNILFPKDPHDLLIMTYVLERLSDWGLIGLGRALHEGPPHWIVLPCPFYGQAISKLAFGTGSKQLTASTSD